MALCFEININDAPPVIAGLEHMSVLTACITFVASQNDLELRVGGLVSQSRHDNEHVEWIQQDLRNGDRVSIRIVEASTPSPPISRKREDPESSEREEREYYQRLKNRYESK